MRIAVVGIGGVGGYIGAKLCSLIGTQKKKYEIVFIARGKHAQAVKQNGLKVIEDDGEFIATPTDVCTAEEVEGTFDLILVCVKSYAIVEALLPLKKNIHAETVVMSFANGVNNVKTINSILDAKVVNACVYILSSIQSAGIIHKQGDVFAITLGDTTWTGESLYIDYIFKDADIPSTFTEKIEIAIWKKYLFISAFASMTSYYNLSIKEVHDQHYDETKTLLEEIVSVANTKGIDIKNETEKALKIAASFPKGTTTSMHRDFQCHRQTELDVLTKYIVDEAELLCIDVPVIRKIYAGLREKN